jgi:hypothetical protein
MNKDKDYTQEEVESFCIEQFLVFGLDDEAALVSNGVRNMALPETVIPTKTWDRLEDHIKSAEDHHGVIIEQEETDSGTEVMVVIYRAPIVEAIRIQANSWPDHLRAGLDGLLL